MCAQVPCVVWFVSSDAEGRLGRIVRPIEDPNGYEAWRLLMQEMEPLDTLRGLSLLEALTSSEVKPRHTRDYMDQVREYESRVALYEQTSGKKFDDDVEIATLLRNAPGKIKTHLRLKADGDTTYVTLRGLLEADEVARRPWTTSTASTSGNGGAARRTSPMVVGVVKGKSKGKKSSSSAKGYPQQQQQCQQNWQQHQLGQGLPDLRQGGSLGQEVYSEPEVCGQEGWQVRRGQVRQGQVREGFVYAVPGLVHELRQVGAQGKGLLEVDQRDGLGQRGRFCTCSYDDEFAGIGCRRIGTPRRAEVCMRCRARRTCSF